MSVSVSEKVVQFPTSLIRIGFCVKGECGQNKTVNLCE